MADYPKPVSMALTKKILEQMCKMKYLMYDINETDDKLNTCFFCKIKYENEFIPVMISNYNIIKYISNNKTINIQNCNIKTIIEFGDIKYLNKEYDLSIIQIKNHDNINFLELDDNLYIEESELYYNKESIYTINYKNKNDISVIYSVINNITKSEIIYQCYPNTTPKNSPIFNLSNNKLIGIYNSYSKYYNKGIFFNFIIKEFISQKRKLRRNKMKSNEIKILINIDKKDINRQIYFLDKGNINTNLKELNELNSELYINNKQYKYNNFFKPENEGKYEIIIKFNYNLIDCSYMFSKCENIIDINFVSFNSKYVMSMESMFYKCKNLQVINLMSFDTLNVDNMSSMFSFCQNLNSIDLSSFNTENVIDMHAMFSHCNKLNNLDLSSFNTKNVADMSDMFSFCENLIELDLSSFYLINIKNMSYMFYYCYNLKKLYLYFNCDINSIDRNYMFEMCTNLNKSLRNVKNDISLNKYENKINIIMQIEKEDINNEIYFLDGINIYQDGKEYLHSHLKELNGFNSEFYIENKKYKFSKYFRPSKKGIYNIIFKFNINLMDCSYMFACCKNIIDINFISFNTKDTFNMSHMFEGGSNCSNLNSLDLSSFNTENVIYMNNMFESCKNLNNLDLSSFNTENVIDMSEMFLFCENLNKLNLSSFNTENVNDMHSMFSYCNNLNNLDLSSFNTRNVTNMCWMFDSCTNLNCLDLSSFNTENVDNMMGMFSECINLNILNLSSFNTKNVIYMNKMFYSCKNLNNLDLSFFNTENVIEMKGMFSDCINLKNLNLSSFNTKNVTIMNEMFRNCYNLINLDLSSFNTENVSKFDGIFDGCPDNINETYCSKFEKRRKNSNCVNV